MKKLKITFHNTLEITVEKVIEAADSTQLNELILLADRKLRQLERDMNRYEIIENYKNSNNEKLGNAPF